MINRQTQSMQLRPLTLIWDLQLAHKTAPGKIETFSELSETIMVLMIKIDNLSRMHTKIKRCRFNKRLAAKEG